VPARGPRAGRRALLRALRRGMSAARRGALVYTAGARLTARGASGSAPPPSRAAARAAARSLPAARSPAPRARRPSVGRRAPPRTRKPAPASALGRSPLRKRLGHLAATPARAPAHRSHWSGLQPGPGPRAVQARPGRAEEGGGRRASVRARSSSSRGARALTRSRTSSSSVLRLACRPRSVSCARRAGRRAVRPAGRRWRPALPARPRPRPGGPCGACVVQRVTRHRGQACLPWERCSARKASDWDRHAAPPPADHPGHRGASCAGRACPWPCCMDGPVAAALRAPGA